MQAQINRITDILRKDNGIDGVMDYTSQISWILFLKFLDDYEKTQLINADLTGVPYVRLLSKEFQWEQWAVPKKDNGKKDHVNMITWDDLIDFVNWKLFPYLKGFKESSLDYHSMKYKIGEIFSFIHNKIESWHTLREVLDIIDALSFQSQKDIFELSQIYESILFNLGSGGKNSGEYYTPRSVIRAIVECVDPQIYQTVYDGAAGSCGFLIEAFEYLKRQMKSTDELNWLYYQALWGNEKTGLGYVMGVMNMILHGIENPNINKKNTLVDNIRDFEEKDGFNMILANPPFWWNERSDIQANFPIKTNATEMLFLQHFMKKLKTWGKAAIIVPEGVLFNTSNAFQEVKKQLLTDFNLHSIVSLPAGIFLPYSGVKTNIIFFEKTKPTEQIRYYEIDLGRKLTKNKPISFEELQPMISAFKKREIWPHSRTVSLSEIKNYDLSAKNPANNKEIIHRDPKEIIEEILSINQKIQDQTFKLRNLII